MILSLISSIALAAEPRCLEERLVEKTVCKPTTKHPVAGAGLGWLVFGPLGAVAGAVIGNSSEQECEKTEEKTCAKYETQKK